MWNRVSRRLVATGAILAVMVPGSAPTASAADGFTDGVCAMWASSAGFGGYCGGGGWSDRSLDPPTWGDLLRTYQAWTRSFGPFIPCRDYPVPPGTALQDPPDGKEWVLRVEIVDYDLSKYNGGPNVHLVRKIVPVSDSEREHCRHMPYMDYFWNQFDSTYPAPELIVKPTYMPRVNVPAYFALTARSSWVIEKELVGWNGDAGIRMRAVVGKMRIDPGDGSPVVDCLMGLDPIGSDGYDESKDPFHQDNLCKHVYKRSSANQPEGMYTVKLWVYWDVAYWKTGVGWRLLGSYPVEAVQRLPVQEVQAIGG